MRLFWLVIGIFMIFAGFIAWAQMDTSRGGGMMALDAETPRTELPAPRSDETNAGAAQDDAMPEPASAVDRRRAEEPRDPSAIDVRSSESAEAKLDEPIDKPLDPDEMAELDAAQQLAEELFDSAMRRETAAPGRVPEDPDAPPAPPTSLDIKREHDHRPEQLQNPPNPWERATKEGDHQPLQHSVEQRADGTIVLDETFEIRGRGTSAEPYEITWDLLLSAAETYQPRLGMNEIPERIQMLDGKHVKISGHLLFPMVGVDAREVLVMLNMWDGCCLGTMPSPYDAVEVQLAAPVRANNRNFMNYGTLEGKLSIDPYLINDWLLGLYVMEGAKLHIGM